MTITPELRYEIEQAGVVRLEDPETHAALRHPEGRTLRASVTAAGKQPR
jgi:hypothetical protein